uniref:tRNA (cytosine(34)-C(5))-methyltransferase n=1 Tax=Anopheles culicifacies TaxID=139723 RepID=A0A182MM40_9DIPT
MGKPKHMTNKQNPFARKKRNNKEKVANVQSQASLLLKLIKQDFFEEYFRAVKELRKEEADALVEPPRCLEWYPREMAWQLELSRKDIRRSEPLFKLHNFLISETSSGYISRQEAVSMIPPLVLGVQSHHRVLDMCAAPGSKTAQLIESLHAGDGGSTPSGFVMANDVDNNRCYMLVHQTKRLNSPCFLVTNGDSATFPSMRYTKKDGTVCLLKFDRVLCDVPCSGDGTLRKNADIWNKWNLAQASNLHGLQYRILKRGAELLEVGGKLVYSTCSLNPIENEAVLHHLLKESNDSLEIVECAATLPTLKYTNGMTYWEPASKDLTFYKTFDDVPESQRTVIRPGMFPPSKEEAVDKYHLDRCLRILPHQQNTGGFFVALLEKKKPLPWETVDVVGDGQELTETTPVAEPPAKKKKYMRGFKEDPFVFFEEKEDVFEELNKFFQLSEDFEPRNLLTRCKVGKKKNVYFCSSIVRDIVQLNEKRVKIINLGVKSFVRCATRNIECDFRLASEGLSSVNPFVGSQRRVMVQKKDLIQLLSCTDPTKPPELTSLSTETQQNLQNVASGSCVLECMVDDVKLITVGWKGAMSLRAYVDQYDTMHMLRLLGGDLSKFEKNKFQDKRAAEVAEDDMDENEPAADVESEPAQNDD